MKISVIHPFYNHNFAVPRHIDNWLRWSTKNKQNTEIIIVDDGSPEQIDLALFKRAQGLKIKIFRIKENILWNVTGARNLGITQSTGEWLFPLDFDMSVLNETIEAFYNAKPDPKYTYWPNLWMPTSKRPDRMRHPHCNSFFIHRDAMLKSGLYDEDFAGQWGWEDSFMHELILPGTGLVRKNMNKFGFIRWYKAFACQHVTKNPSDYTTENFSKFKQKERQYKQGTYKNGPILRFSWEKIYDSR